MPDVLPPDSEDALTDRQDKALWAFLRGNTVREAAEAAGASERTLYRWLQAPSFRRALRSRRRIRFLQGLGSLQGATARAAEALDSVLSDPDASSASRVAAARSILQYACQSFEIDDIDGRLEDLERARDEAGDSPETWM